jgi:hypothetical protein
VACADGSSLDGRWRERGERGRGGGGRAHPRWPDITRYSFHGACHSGLGHLEGMRRITCAEVGAALSVAAANLSICLDFCWNGINALLASLPPPASPAAGRSSISRPMALGLAAPAGAGSVLDVMPDDAARGPSVTPSHHHPQASFHQFSRVNAHVRLTSDKEGAQRGWVLCTQRSIAGWAAGLLHAVW